MVPAPLEYGRTRMNSSHLRHSRTHRARVNQKRAEEARDRERWEWLRIEIERSERLLGAENLLAAARYRERWGVMTIEPPDRPSLLRRLLWQHRWNTPWRTGR